MQVGAPQNLIGDLGRFVAQNENAGGIGKVGVQTADRCDSFDCRKCLGAKVDAVLRAGCTKRGKGACVFLDKDAVAAAQGDIKRWVLVKVLKLDLSAMLAADDRDLRNFRRYCDATGLGQH